MPKRDYYEDSTRSRKNWPQIDEKHASLVNVVVEEIKAMRQLVRASRQLIAEMAGFNKYLEKLHKLPRLSKQLERYEENIETFQVRKMLKEARRILDKGNYTFPRSVRECHIYNVKNALHIQEALDNFLSENGLD